MTPRRIAAALIALPAAFALAACASSATSGNGQTAAAAKAATSSSASTGSSGGSASTAGVTKETLAAQLHDGLAKVTSAHISMNIDAAGQKITGVGDEKLAGGKLQAMSLAMNFISQQFQMVIVDGKSYVKLPAGMSQSGKPWMQIDANSSNPTVAQIGKQLGQTLNSASLSNVGAFVNAAKSVQDEGKQTVAGVQTEKLHVVIDPSKLPVNSSALSSITSAGIDSLPFDVYLDDQHRPVQLSMALTAQGQSVKFQILITKYNQPVTITAPPASQVGH